MKRTCIRLRSRDCWRTKAHRTHPLLCWRRWGSCQGHSTDHQFAPLLSWGWSKTGQNQDPTSWYILLDKIEQKDVVSHGKELAVATLFQSSKWCAIFSWATGLTIENGLKGPFLAHLGNNWRRHCRHQAISGQLRGDAAFEQSFQAHD